MEEKTTAGKIFSAFLKTKKMRKTPERLTVLDAISKTSSIFDAMDIYNMLEANFRISLATIYSTLDLLQKCNLVVRHNFCSTVIKYEKTRNDASHYYRICMQCHSVKEFSDKKLKKSISLRQFSAFNKTYHTLYLYGVCKKCKKQ